MKPSRFKVGDYAGYIEQLEVMEVINCEQGLQLIKLKGKSGFCCSDYFLSIENMNKHLQLDKPFLKKVLSYIKRVKNQIRLEIYMRKKLRYGK